VGLKRPAGETATSLNSEQQSHHCGIETAVAEVCKQNLGQQSHHCGIETISVCSRSSASRLQQSHHCGIETWIVQKIRNLLPFCSNRTIVGLKLFGYQLAVKRYRCSNRTIVGLKPQQLLKF